MSVLIKLVLLYILVSAVFVFLVNFIDEHSVDIWNKILETPDEIWDKVEQLFSERSENEEK